MTIMALAGSQERSSRRGGKIVEAVREFLRPKGWAGMRVDTSVRPYVDEPGIGEPVWADPQKDAKVDDMFQRLKGPRT